MSLRMGRNVGNKRGELPGERKGRNEEEESVNESRAKTGTSCPLACLCSRTMSIWTWLRHQRLGSEIISSFRKFSRPTRELNHAIRSHMFHQDWWDRQEPQWLANNFEICVYWKVNCLYSIPRHLPYLNECAQYQNPESPGKNRRLFPICGPHWMEPAHNK